MSKNIPQLRFEGFTYDWEQRKLGEVATLSSSKRIHLSDYVTEGIPFYRGSEISTGGITGNQELFISQEKFDEIKEKYGVPSEGDILVTAVGTLGNLWKVDSRRFYYKDGNLIQISKMQVNSDYLLTYFTGGIGKKRLLDSAAGSNQKALTMVKMREITVDFPSEDEQKKIGAFFKQLDDTITLHQRKLDLLKEQKKGYLQKMFPKKGEKVPELRFAGFVDDWEERKLGDISYKVKEKNKTGEFTETLTNSAEYGIINQRDFFDKDISNAKNLTGYYVVKNDDFVYNPRISNFAPVGPIKRNKLGRTGVMSPLYYVFRTHDIDKNYFEKYFDTVYWHRFMELNGDSGARADRFAIKDSVFVEMPIPYPTMDEQQKIGSFFQQLDNTITLHQLKLDLLKEQKKGFLQKMFA